MWQLLTASTLVRRLMHERGMSGRKACKSVLSSGREYFEDCPFETFRQKVMAVAGIPLDKLFDDDPNDKPVVRQFKDELRDIQDWFALVEDVGRSRNPNLEAAIRAYNRRMLETFGVDFLGEN